jgi:hypothetical protein
MKLFELQNPSLPIRKMVKVFHVGSMDASHKRSGSYEGSGLSVAGQHSRYRLISSDRELPTATTVSTR